MCKKILKWNKNTIEMVVDDETESSSEDDFTDSDSDDAVVADETLATNNPEQDSADDQYNDDEEEEEDEVIKAIRAAQNVQRTHPPDIQSEEFIVDICFHPARELLAVADMGGDVNFYKYSNEANELVNTLELHSKACRAIDFSFDGKIIYSTAKDKAIRLSDVDTGKLIRNYEDAHEEPVFCLTVIDENVFATGDDNGVVSVWDARSRETTPIFSLKECDDYITDMITNEAKKYLVCASADGSLMTVNMNTRNLHVQTEEYEEEFTCLGLYRQEAKIVAGSSKGKLYTFNWNEFGLHCDMYPGPKRGISCMIPITENIVITAWEDGVLRATYMCPQKHLGVVGCHDLPVESMDICNDGTLIASSSHNNDIKFWNVQYFEDFEKLGHKEKHSKIEIKKNLPSSKCKDASDFFSGLC